MASHLYLVTPGKERPQIHTTVTGPIPKNMALELLDANITAHQPCFLVRATPQTINRIVICPPCLENHVIPPIIDYGTSRRPSRHR